MHVLITADTLGGVFTYVLELVEAMRPHGVRFTVATMGAPPTADQKEALERLDNAALEASAFKLEWMDEPWQDLARASDWLLDLEERHKPDVVHLNSYAHGALGWHAPTLVVGHSCVLSWWKAVKGEPAPESWNRYRNAVSRGLRRAQAVVAPSRAMLQSLVEHYGPLPPARVIYNGRNPAQYRPANKERIVFGAGRLWDEAKGAALLGEVAPRLSWPVYLAGEPRDPEGRKAYLGGSQLLGQLSQEAMARWLSHASIYAAPVRYEPFGLSALEAALSGCALVLGDIPSQREVWGPDAEYVTPGDGEQLWRTLEHLIGDSARRQELANAALARARRYAPERMAAEYLALYRRLAARESAQAEEPACAS